jgi:transposase
MNRTRGAKKERPAVKKINKNAKSMLTYTEQKMTVGLDLGDRWSHYWIENKDGEMVESGKTKTTREALSAHFPAGPPMRIALETGTHSNWVRTHLESLGHQVIVANARQLRAITGSDRKSDPQDARKLAMYARIDPSILCPIQHRSLQTQQDVAVVRARAALVRARTMLINAARGLAKASGHRLPTCASERFAARSRTVLPAGLEASVGPLLEQTDQLSLEIQKMEVDIEKLANQSYPETARLKQVPGVGPITALTYLLTIEDPSRFGKSRDVGSFLGLCPRQSQSGKRDPQLGISKAGNGYLRLLLVQCAHRVMWNRAPDSALKRWGVRLCERGGKNAKKRAVVAIARKLSVLLHKLWVSGDSYDPLYGCRRDSGHVAA